MALWNISRQFHKFNLYKRSARQAWMNEHSNLWKINFFHFAPRPASFPSWALTAAQLINRFLLSLLVFAYFQSENISRESEKDGSRLSHLARCSTCIVENRSIVYFLWINERRFDCVAWGWRTRGTRRLIGKFNYECHQNNASKLNPYQLTRMIDSSLAFTCFWNKIQIPILEIESNLREWFNLNTKEENVSGSSMREEI